MEQAEGPDQAPPIADSTSAVAHQLTFSDWAAPLFWMAALFVLSTTLFSAANTSRIIEPILKWIFPTASFASISLAHAIIRKVAHFTNYAILFWLLIRGPLKGRPYIALGCCVIYAFVDEGHQIFVPGRTASLYDVALDSSGALFSRFLNLAVDDAA
jgi:VanZ family protein